MNFHRKRNLNFKDTTIMFTQELTPPPFFDADRAAARHEESWRPVSERYEFGRIGSHRTGVLAMLSRLLSPVWNWAPWPVDHPRAQGSRTAY